MFDIVFSEDDHECFIYLFLICLEKQIVFVLIIIVMCTMFTIAILAAFKTKSINTQIDFKIS